VHSPYSTVIVADDHPVVLSGVRLALRGTKDLIVMAEAEDGMSTLAAIGRAPPDLLILDLWMGGNDGFDLLRRIHEAWPLVRVLVYSMNDERSYGPRVLRAGAAGYLMKTHGLDELIRALRILAAGNRYLSPVLAEDLIRAGLFPHPDRSNPAELANLSQREIQILRLIGTGLTTARISRELGISVKTVGAHRENLKNKMNVESSVLLAHKAVQLVENRIL